MKIIDLIRLVRKHLVLLLTVPAVLAAMVMIMTRKPHFTYSSQTVLYTGLATGSSIEMDKAFNYFATNTAFDNLLNIINSREAQQEVAIRLLSQHLMLNSADPKYISHESYAQLKRITPAFIYKYIARGASMHKNVPDSLNKADSISMNHDPESGTGVNLFPASLNRVDYEHTVQNLTDLMKSSDSNFVYKLLNFTDPHYSIAAISKIKASRIANSDLIKLSYEVDDPGICQQTLAIFNEVAIKNYKLIKENRSDEVVKYFEHQLADANDKLRLAEDKLLAFNKENNIINYYEQSKAVAVVKEDMEVNYNDKRAQLAGLEAGIHRLEEKLNIQQQIQLQSGALLEKKKQLGDINYEVASAEANGDAESAQRLPGLKQKAEALKTDIRKSVDNLYTYQNTTDGLPVSTVLNEWINNVIEAENLKARLSVMDKRNHEFQQQYSIYAPAGANIKRIEREIAVSEQGYIELLHGLNEAKLKLQDNELSANLKAVDPPFFPLSPNPSSRKVLIIVAAFLGILLVLGTALMMEYSDNTLRNLKRTEKTLNMPALGILPKIYRNPGISRFDFVTNRLLENAVQHIEQYFNKGEFKNGPKVITVISALTREGKSVIAGRLAEKFKSQGKKVLYLNYSTAVSVPARTSRFPLLHRFLGYADPRIDPANPVLAVPPAFLTTDEYKVCNADQAFYKISNLSDITVINEMQPDYVFVELPALLIHNYPTALVSQSDLNVLVCRSNRIWSEADQALLDGLRPLVDNRIHFMLNGTEIQELESVLGELPKKRSALRKKIKNFFRFQFFTKNDF